VRDVILVLLFAVALPLMVWRPPVGALTWALFALMNPQRLTWGFAYSLPFSQLIIGATLLGMLFSREPKKVKGGAAAIVLFLFVCYMAVTTLFALNPTYATPMLERSVKIQIGTFLALLLLYKKEHVIALMWVIAISIGFYAIKGGVYTLLTLGAGRVWGPLESFIFDNNAFALATVMSIPVWAFLYTQYSENKWARWGIPAAIVLSALSALGSQSRGALLAIAAMAVFLWAKSHRKLLTGPAIALLAVALVAFMPDVWSERMSTIREYEQDESAIGRIETWTMLYNLASARPFLGGGFEPYERWIFEIYNPGYSGTHSAHSIYFQVLGEHGFVALGLFLLFWGLVWRMCSQIVRATEGRPDDRWAYWIAQMTKVSLVAYLVGGAFLNLAYWDMPYFLFVAVAVTRWIVRQPATAPAKVPLRSVRPGRPVPPVPPVRPVRPVRTGPFARPLTAMHRKPGPKPG
jgi:putative inorganic carbon (hco3(-)) transporter